MKCKILGILKKNCFSAVSTEGDNLIVVTEGDIENITIDVEKEMEAFAEYLIGRNTEWITKLQRNETAKTLIELWEQERKEATE